MNNWKDNFTRNMTQKQVNAALAKDLLRKNTVLIQALGVSERALEEITKFEPCKDAVTTYKEITDIARTAQSKVRELIDGGLSNQTTEGITDVKQGL